jgi:hypothetical protein
MINKKVFNKEVLTEKLKYLISMDAKNFEIKDFTIDFMFDAYQKEKLLEYDVYIKFDFNGGIDNESDVIGYDIKNMCDELGKSIYTYGINKNGKLTTEGNYNVYPAMIWKINYDTDSTHIFDVSYKVVLENE